MRFARRAQQLGHPLGGQRAVVVAARAHRVGVGVGGARHLPDPEAVGVGLLRQLPAEKDHVGLALQHEDRHPGVVTDALALRRDRHPRRLHPQPRADAGMNTPSIETPDAGPAVHEEAVEELRLGIDGVDVGHQAGGRLRLAGGEDLRRRQAAERVLVGRQLQQRADLREDVEGPGVAGMLQVPVALRRQQLEVDALDEASPVDADLLRRHADPGVTRRGQVTMEEPPVGRGVDAGRHVVPLDHDRPAEAQRILGRRATNRVRKGASAPGVTSQWPSAPRSPCNS